MFDRILTTLFGSKNERDVKTLLPIVAKINQKEDWAASLSDDGIKEASKTLRAQIAAADDAGFEMSCKKCCRKLLRSRVNVQNAFWASGTMMCS